MTVKTLSMMFLCTYNSASLRLFPSAPARVHSNIDIVIDIDIHVLCVNEPMEGQINSCHACKYTIILSYYNGARTNFCSH